MDVGHAETVRDEALLDCSVYVFVAAYGRKAVNPLEPGTDRWLTLSQVL